ncbi:MAG: 5-oxoprolinase subunit PxpB [Pseudomonadota bacterium]
MQDDRERMTATHCEPLADDALLLHFGAGTPPIDPAANARVHRAVARIRAAGLPWLRDLVPAFASLAVFFDPDAIDADAARRRLDVLLDSATMADEDGAPAPCIEIPVVYGGSFGEDLDAAAAALGLTPDALVARHSAAIYTVAMIGFAPGFPYLSGLDPALALPRLPTPRTRVPAGSVAIGGAQTGIYPHESPGGWRLLGRTPLRLFDPTRATPSLLAPGDRVRFRPIPAEDFDGADAWA